MTYSMEQLATIFLKHITKDEPLKIYLENVVTFPDEHLYIDEDMIQQGLLFIEGINKNETDAYYAMGHLLRNLDCYDSSFYCFKHAHNAGLLQATYWLGNFHYEGFGTEENSAKALECYKLAANAGLADAMNNYADMLLHGEVVEKNEEEAYVWFNKAAMLGVSEAMFTMGYMYEKGVVVEADESTSIAWFKKAAILGDLYAANYLGHKAMQHGDFEEAFAFYMQAARGQDVEGEYNVGFCFEEGIGIEQNKEKAIYWLKRAALQGDDLAKQRLALLQ
ncbi:tetratricopeptide repeat protein [Kurthia senegalensis]|uniref:tetratricopeptide repeat protein n=1 Tax=Kurthia senegalensis TaxID=1033740 RepID=UPI0002883459|nr:SEL1-like repeat protein [Kurthia senegalensis]